MLVLQDPGFRPERLETIDEVTDSEASENFEKMKEHLEERQQQDESFRSTEVIRYNDEAIQALMAELNGDVIGAKNVANQSANRIEEIHSEDPQTRAREVQRNTADIIGDAPNVGQLTNTLVQEDADASRRFDRGDGIETVLKIFIAFCCLITVAGIGLVIYGLVAMGQRSQLKATEPSFSSDPPLGESAVGHRMINLTSMVLEASNDNPGVFNKLGISQACYAQFRQAILQGQYNVPESLWWQLLADQALEPYPNSGILLTPANHYMALALCLDCLRPLYPAQPMDLDLDATVESLASSLNLLDPTCMAGYYARMLDFVPEESGANRAQRIFLARAGLARAFSRLPA